MEGVAAINSKSPCYPYGYHKTIAPKDRHHWSNHSLQMPEYGIHFPLLGCPPFLGVNVNFSILTIHFIRNNIVKCF